MLDWVTEEEEDLRRPHGLRNVTDDYYLIITDIYQIPPVCCCCIAKLWVTNTVSVTLTV